MFTTIDTIENGQSFKIGYDKYTMAGKAILGSKTRVKVDPYAESLRDVYEYFPSDTIVEVVS